jgi:hypothetical protein
VKIPWRAPRVRSWNVNGAGVMGVRVPGNGPETPESNQKWVRSSTGTSWVDVYQAVRLTIQGRDLTVDVMEVSDDVPVLIGQIPLEMLDLVIDLPGRRLIGNPAHGGEHILELY